MIDKKKEGRPQIVRYDTNKMHEEDLKMGSIWAEGEFPCKNGLRMCK